MKKQALVAALFTAFALAACDDDNSDDYSYTSENCNVVDFGDGEQYELCCNLSCHTEYDHDDYHEQCTEDLNCTTPSGDPCPHEIVDQYGYPQCIYY